MNQPAAQLAIKAALSAKWDEAIEYNFQILKDEPEDIESLNRLAKAYVSIGQTKNAKKTWNKVLRLDRYNPIATLQLEKLKNRSPSKRTNLKQATSGQTFLDEPGKTKTTQLVKLASVKILMNLEPGQSVTLIPKMRFVTAVTQNNEYVGSLPDDLSAHLGKLIRGGNKYHALIRRVEKNSVHLFIKELKKSKRYEHVHSFTPSKTPKAINIETPPSITKVPIDIAPTGEEETYK